MRRSWRRPPCRRCRSSRGRDERGSRERRGGGVKPGGAVLVVGFLLGAGPPLPHRGKADRNAADAVARLSSDQREELQRNRGWGGVPGIGPKTALVISQAMAGEVPEYLQRLREEKQPLTQGGATLRAAIRGDLHCHSTWSDGGSPLEEMMITARQLGHEYCAITDHSPRLKVARGLSADRLREQMQVVRDLNDALTRFRVLQGIEVDILEDGEL